MTKDVLISVKGLQYSTEETEGEDQRIETINRGVYSFRNGHGHVVYDDEAEEGVTVKTHIKFSEDCVEVMKKGPYSVHLLFETGKKNYTDYNTPFGNLVIGIDTVSIDMEESEDSVDISIVYEMEMNYEHLAHCDIEIHIKSCEEQEKTNPVSQ